MNLAIYFVTVGKPRNENLNLLVGIKLLNTSIFLYSSK